MVGEVKWFDSKKGYGFIIAPDGKEIFVHYSQIQAEGFKTLNQKDRVSFETSEVAGKGLQAMNVTVVKE